MTNLLVRIDPSLPTARVNAMMLNVRYLPGVEAVCLLEAVSQETLHAILLAPIEPAREAPRVAAQGSLL